ncbi:MAG: chromate transporter [Clostridia bacterium]|nr:chromate transporter [Clostridia bacterium]
MILLILFYEFFKTGLFSVGGGLSAIPFFSEMADKYDWLTHEMLADIIAIAESTPGPICVNMATYAGYVAAGIPGALVATLSVVMPSFLIIIIISKVLEKYRKSMLVDSTFKGIRPASAGLIAAAGWSVVRVAIFAANDNFALFGGEYGVDWNFDWRMLVLFAGLLAVTNIKPFKKLHPIVFIAFAALFGIAIGLI